MAIHDIVVQPEAKDLLLGTHGRSIYQANIAPLQHMNEQMRGKAETVFAMNSVRYSNRWGRSWNQWVDAYEPEETIVFYTSSAGKKTITISSEAGDELNRMTVAADEGFNYVPYNLELTEKGKKALMKADSKLSINKAGNGKYYLPKGSYTVSVGDAKTKLEIK